MAKQRGPGAVAGPLAGVRAPQRVSAPPSSGLAAAPLWPDPGERSPGRPFFSPRAGVTAVSRDGEVGHPVPFLPLSLIQLFGFFARFADLGLGFGWPLFFFFSPI